MKFKDYANQADGEKIPFIKLKDGEKILGVFRGDLYEFFQVWESKEVFDHPTKGASFRFRVNFITKDGTAYVAKVLEQGATVYNMLKDLNETYPLEETVVEVRRMGSTKDDTRYSILPVPPKNQPTEASWKIINSVKLIDLKHKKPKAQASPEPDFDQAPWPDEPPPIDDEHSEIPF